MQNESFHICTSHHQHSYMHSHRKQVLGYRRLWQFAIHAVLQDLGKHWPPQRLSGESLLHWRSQRQLYTDLWRRKLQLQRQKSSPVQVLTAFPMSNTCKRCHTEHLSDLLPCSCSFNCAHVLIPMFRLRVPTVCPQTFVRHLVPMAYPVCYYAFLLVCSLCLGESLWPLLATQQDPDVCITPLLFSALLKSVLA